MKYPTTLLDWEEKYDIDCFDMQFLNCGYYSNELCAQLGYPPRGMGLQDDDQMDVLFTFNDLIEQVGVEGVSAWIKLWEVEYLEKVLQDKLRLIDNICVIFVSLGEALEKGLYLPEDILKLYNRIQKEGYVKVYKEEELVGNG